MLSNTLWSSTLTRRVELPTKHLLGLVALAITVASHPQPSCAERLPIEAFAAAPLFEDVSLSPDGQRVVAVLNLKSGSTVVVKEVANPEAAEALLRSEDVQFRFGSAVWANDDLILVSVVFPHVRYGIQTRESRMLVVDRHTKEARNLLPTKSWQTGARFVRNYSQFQTDIVDLLPDDPNHILLALDKKMPGSKGVYRVDLRSLRQVPVLSAKSGVFRWLADRQHRIRVGVRLADERIAVITRPPEGGTWQTTWSFDALGRDAVTPVGFSNDPDILYVSAFHLGRRAIFRVDLSDESHPRELVLSDPRYDVTGGLIYSPVTNDAIGVRFSATDSAHSFWAEKFKLIGARIDKALPKRVNHVIGFSHDEQQFLVSSVGRDTPDTYYFGDLRTHRLVRIGTDYPDVGADDIGAKTTVVYEARDGVEIEAQVTLPPGTQKRPLPTVIFPHGGPHVRDSAGFDVWTAFFSNRGYAVLQPNFRGSYGYGYDFFSQGVQGWGLAMQDDIEDGTRWMIEEGIADPDRICIVGWSYGGYAALMGVVRTPELYRCAVGGAGVYDLHKFVRSRRQFSNYDVVREQIGKERSDLRNRSPVTYAKRVQVPVLLLHGADDRVVDVSQSREMYRALKDLGKEVSYVEQERGDHQLGNHQVRVEAFTEIEAFLAEHLD